jgi:hypothetical protein
VHAPAEPIEKENGIAANYFLLSAFKRPGIQIPDLALTLGVGFASDLIEISFAALFAHLRRRRMQDLA